MKTPRGGSEKLSPQGSLAKSARAISTETASAISDCRPGLEPGPVTARCEEEPVVRSRFNYCGRGYGPGSRPGRQPALPPGARLLGRTLRGFREFCGNCRGLRGRTPTRRLAAVAPGAGPIEGVDAELVHLLHLIDPGRPHPIGVVVRRPV